MKIARNSLAQPIANSGTRNARRTTPSSGRSHRDDRIAKRRKKTDALSIQFLMRALKLQIKKTKRLERTLEKVVEQAQNISQENSSLRSAQETVHQECALSPDITRVQQIDSYEGRRELCETKTQYYS